MTVNLQVHKIVVMLDDNACGFTSLSSAIQFIEEAYAGQDYSKIYTEIELGINDPANSDLKIYDIDTYADTFIEDEEDDE